MTTKPRRPAGAPPRAKATEEHLASFFGGPIETPSPRRAAPGATATLPKRAAADRPRRTEPRAKANPAAGANRATQPRARARSPRLEPVPAPTETLRSAPTPRAGAAARVAQPGRSANPTPKPTAMPSANPAAKPSAKRAAKPAVRAKVVQAKPVARRPRKPQRTRRERLRLVRRTAHRRLVVCVLVLLIAFGGLLVRLAMLQAVNPERYVERAQSQRLVNLDIPAERGAIVDRNGQPLVATVVRQTIWTDTKQVEDPVATAKALAPLLGIDEAELAKTLASGAEFVHLGRQVDDDVAEKVAALDLKGIYLKPEMTRARPADVAGAITGDTDVDNVGTAGIELKFDDVLAGTPGLIRQEESREGHTIPAGSHRVIPAQPGSDLVLTLDRDLQYQVEQRLAAGVEATGGKRGTAIVMDAATGEIYALANVARAGTKSETPGKVVPTDENLAVTNQLELGSVIKPVTLAAGMERANLRASSPIYLPAKLTLYDEDFVDPGRYEDTSRSVEEILKRSSNIGAISIARMAGDEALEEYLLRFHFGARTGIALPHEASGFVPARADWSGTSIATLAIGQGITMTPLQLAAAYAAIANGGEWTTPQIVRATVDPDGRHRPMNPPDRTRIITPETASELRRMLGAVVADGTGKRAAVPGFDVGGKTGTAWKVQADGSYGSDGNRAYVATFAGMVPVVDPKLVIVVVIDEPAQSTYSGGDAAAPVFAAMAQPALRAAGVSPQHGLVGSADNVPEGKVRAKAAEADPTVVPKLPAAAVAAATPATIAAAVPVAPPPAAAPAATPGTPPATAVTPPPAGAAPPADTTAPAVPSPAAAPVAEGAPPPAAPPPGATPAEPPPTTTAPDPGAAPPATDAPGATPTTVAPASTAPASAPATAGGGGG